MRGVGRKTIRKALLPLSRISNLDNCPKSFESVFPVTKETKANLFCRTAFKFPTIDVIDTKSNLFFKDSNAFYYFLKAFKNENVENKDLDRLSLDTV